MVYTFFLIHKLQDFAVPAAKLTRESVAHSREHMQVYLRIRPFTNREKEQGESQVKITSIASVHEQ